MRTILMLVAAVIFLAYGVAVFETKASQEAEEIDALKTELRMTRNDLNVCHESFTNMVLFDGERK